VSKSWEYIEKFTFGIFKPGRPVSEYIAFIFIAVGVTIFILVFTGSKFDSVNVFKSEHIDIKEFGDFLGGAVGSLWSLAGVLLFYAALADQRKDLEEQKEILAMQIRETVNQTKEFRQQNETATEQKNEGTFFQLLRFHNEIITSITLEIQDMDFSDGSSTVRVINGRKSFVEYYDIYKRFFNTQFETYSSGGIDKEVLQIVINTSYDQFYEEYQADLGHYFRNIYNILKFVDVMADTYRNFYLSLLLAQLSNNEVALLFYHCIAPENKNFKQLIEKYGLMSTVPDDEITSMCKVLYNSVAFGENSLGEDDDFNSSYGAGFDSSNNERGNEHKSPYSKQNGKIKLSDLYGDEIHTASKSSESSSLIYDKLTKLYEKNPRTQEEIADTEENYNDDYNDNEDINPILAKFKSINSASSNESGDDEEDFSDNSILAKLSKIRKDTNDFSEEGNQYSIPRVPSFAENNAITNDDDLASSLMAKLSKVKKGYDAGMQIEEEAPSFYTPKIREDNTDLSEDSITAKLAKLKKNTNSDLDNYEEEDSFLTSPSETPFNNYSADDEDDDLAASLLSKLKNIKKDSDFLQDDELEDSFFSALDENEDVEDDLDSNLLNKLKNIKKDEDFLNENSDDFFQQDEDVSEEDLNSALMQKLKGIGKPYNSDGDSQDEEEESEGGFFNSNFAEEKDILSKFQNMKDIENADEVPEELTSNSDTTNVSYADIGTLKSKLNAFNSDDSGIDDEEDIYNSDNFDLSGLEDDDEFGSFFSSANEEEEEEVNFDDLKSRIKGLQNVDTEDIEKIILSEDGIELDEEAERELAERIKTDEAKTNVENAARKNIESTKENSSSNVTKSEAKPISQNPNLGFTPKDVSPKLTSLSKLMNKGK